MENIDLNPIFAAYAERLIHHLHTNVILNTFHDSARLVEAQVQDGHDWQLALPVISCLAAGGKVENGMRVAEAWYPIYLASEILDSVEDKEFEPDQFVSSSEVAVNLSTSLIFFAFQTLTLLQEIHSVGRVTSIFAKYGFDATFGQHRDLTKAPKLVGEALNDYIEMTILKSGSVFRMATAGGAAAATSEETIVEALGDYGTSLGVLLQLIDDCRDAFTQSQDAMHWEVSLPLLLYLLTIEEEKIEFPAVSSRDEWGAILNRAGVINAISSLLLEWNTRSIESLRPLPPSTEKMILEKIPALILEHLIMNIKKVTDGNAA